MSSATLHKSKVRNGRAAVLGRSAGTLRFDTLLESGDHFDADNFLRRYEQYNDEFRAELVEGVVYVNPGINIGDEHAGGQRLFQTWLGVYEAHTPGVFSRSSVTLRLDAKNVVEPDALFGLESSGRSRLGGGRTKIRVGTPELLVEVTKSTVTRDLHEKFEAYERNGVREYIVHLLEQERIIWFHLHGRRFAESKLQPDGSLRSAVFPGLWLDARTAVRGDIAGVLKKLEEGLASAEHAAFVRKLSAK